MTRITREAPRKEAKLAVERAKQEKKSDLGDDDDSCRPQEDAGKSNLDPNKTKVWRYVGQNLVEVKNGRHDFKPERPTLIPDVGKAKDDLYVESEKLRSAGKELSQNICTFYKARISEKDDEISWLKKENDLLRERITFLSERLKDANASMEGLMQDRLQGVDSSLNLQKKLEGLFS